MGLLQAPGLPLHGVQNAVEIVHAIRMAETTHADALVRRVRKVLVGPDVDHLALTHRGDHRAVALAVTAADADHLVLVGTRSFLAGGSKSRHRGAAHSGGSGHSGGSLEKASARNALDRGLQLRHCSSYLQMQQRIALCPPFGRHA